MIVGNFNYHQILFALETFINDAEKLGYLEKIASELNRIITCFESPQALPLKMYASNNINLVSGCNELKELIKQQFDLVTTNPYDKRYPGEGQLRGIVRLELTNYKKLLTAVEDEINNIGLETKKIYIKQNNKEVCNYVVPEKLTPNYISGILKTENVKIIWNNSLGELIDLVKVISVLEQNNETEERDIITYICDNFVNSKQERFSSIQVEKVHKMLQNTFWLNSKSASPKFYQ
jgi:hypothetical protein